MIQLIGTIKVTSPDFSTKTVLLQQETQVNEENIIVSARKIFTLNNVDGEEVYRTANPLLFRQQDGTVLKKAGHFQMNTISSVI